MVTLQIANTILTVFISQIDPPYLEQTVRYMKNYLNRKSESLSNFLTTDNVDFQDDFNTKLQEIFNNCTNKSLLFKCLHLVDLELQNNNKMVKITTVLLNALFICFETLFEAIDFAAIHTNEQDNPIALSLKVGIGIMFYTKGHNL